LKDRFGPKSNNADDEESYEDEPEQTQEEFDPAMMEF